MKTSARRLASLGSCVVTLLSLRGEPVHAQEAARPSDEARPLFEAGKAAYLEGRYAEAARSFEQVYARTGHPYMLRNLGNAYERLGQHARALDAFERYLVLASDGPYREEVEAQVRTLRSASEPLATPPAQGREPRALATPVAAAADSPGLLEGRTFAWVALASTAALGGATALVWLDTRGDYRLLAQTCGQDGGCSEARVAEVESGVTTTNALLGASAVALALTVVLWIAEAPDRGGLDVEHVRLSPLLAASGLSLRGEL